MRYVTTLSMFGLALSGILLAYPASGHGALKTKKEIPEFLGIAEWFNSPPLTRKTLTDKVVLVHFWNYASIACLRQIEFLKQWQEKYATDGLVVVGVYSPEFEFERDLSNVRRMVETLKIPYPVAVDSDFLMWRAYEVRQRPTTYLTDARGRIRYVLEGEGDLKQCELRFRDLIQESKGTVNAKWKDLKPLADFDKIRTPQMNLGYRNLSGFGNNVSIKADIAQSFEPSPDLRSNRFYLSGTWIPKEECLHLTRSPGAILLQYEASRVYLVVGTKNHQRVTAEARLDGKPLTKDNAGKDIKFKRKKASLSIGEYRLYELIDTKGDYAKHLLEVEFSEADVDAYTISFG